MRAEIAAAWQQALRRLRALVHGRDLDREHAEEVTLHLELEAEELARTEGLLPEEARRRARVAFGGVDRYAEAHRDARGWRWLEDLIQDARHATRGLLRTPTFSLSAILVLGLGIGASAAVLSAVDAVLLTRLPYPDPDRIVRIFEQDAPNHRWAISAADVQAVETLDHTFSAVGALNTRIVPVAAAGEPVELAVGRVNAGFFKVLGVHVAYGRDLTPDDSRPGAPGAAVVSYAYAQGSLGGVAAALGRAITVDGTTYTVVGVLPESVRQLMEFHLRVWLALQMGVPPRRGPFMYRLIARQAPGVSFAQARNDLADLSRRIFPVWQSSFQDKDALLTPYPIREVLLYGAARQLGIFGGAVALVLLVAIANVASLMLVRVTGRWREVTVRATLGAGRGRLVRMLATECLILALAGALVGAMVGAAGLRLLALIASDLNGIGQAAFGLRGVGIALGVALLTGLAIAVYPVSLVFRRESGVDLREGDRATGAGRRTGRLRAAFVTAEFALALPLLAGAGLLLNSFLRLERVNPGFDADHLLTAAIRLPSARYPGDSAIRAYWSRALPLVRAVPGVVAAGLGTALPPSDENVCCNNFDLIDHPAGAAAQPSSPWADVDTGYFAALGVPLLEGRLLTAGDTLGAPPAVIVSRSWARHYFPEGNVVGRQMYSGGCTTCPRTTIVGVVGDVKYQGLGESGDAIYDAVAAGWSNGLYLLVRTRGRPVEAMAGVRAALRSVDPGVPLDDVAPMSDRVSASVADPRMLTWLVGGFAAVALVLAAIGIFGMLSYAVATRRREIGVRMALGARSGRVVSMIVGQGVRQALIGALIGLFLAAAGTRLLAATLFGVSATDPSTLAAVTAVLVVVALLASWLAARRAAGVDPVEAMRAE